MNRDVVVIGAGPAGLLATNEIAKRGYSVSVLEEHESIGEPDHCAGLLSTSGLKRLGIKLPRDIIQNTVDGARIYSPSGYSITVERGKREANVIDRRLFDAWLASKASDSGAEIITQAKAQEFLRSDRGISGIRAKMDRNSVLNARAFIIAEGSRCRLSGSLNFPIVQKSSKYAAFQYEVSGVDIEENVVEMFYGKSVAPGFFAWIIPLGDNRARIGLASNNKSKPRLKALINHHKVISNRNRTFTWRNSTGRNANFEDGH